MVAIFSPLDDPSQISMSYSIAVVSRHKRASESKWPFCSCMAVHVCYPRSRVSKFILSFRLFCKVPGHRPAFFEIKFEVCLESGSGKRLTDRKPFTIQSDPTSGFSILILWLTGTIHLAVSEWKFGRVFSWFWVWTEIDKTVATRRNLRVTVHNRFCPLVRSNHNRPRLTSSDPGLSIAAIPRWRVKAYATGIQPTWITHFRKSSPSSKRNWAK